MFALLSALAALALLGWVTSTGGCKRGEAAMAAVSEKLGPSDADWESKIAAANTARDEEAARRLELASDVNDLSSENEDLETQLEELRAKLAKANSDKGDLQLKADGLVGDLDTSNTELASLKDQLKKLKGERDGLQGKLDSTVNTWTNKLSAANNEKKSTATKLADALDRLNKMKGASTDLDEARKRNNQLKNRVGELEVTLNKLGAEKNKLSADAAAKDKAMQAQKAKSVADKDKAIADLEKKNKALEDQVNKLKAKNSEDSRNMAANMDKQMQALKKEHAELKKKADDAAKDCKAQVAKLSAEIDRLKKELAKKPKTVPAPAPVMELKRAGDFDDLDLPLLVNDPAKLRNEFKPLFIQMRKADDTPAARTKLYDTITKGGKAKPSGRILFNAGSAYAQGGEATKLAELIEKVKKGDKLLVVGYASQDGDPKSNYELSSRRASVTAKKILDSSDIDEDDIQAVYFGETKRFDAGSEPPNRTVEIWSVK